MLLRAFLVAVTQRGLLSPVTVLVNGVLCLTSLVLSDLLMRMLPHTAPLPKTNLLPL